MEIIQKKRREVFFTNLLLLGFDTHVAEKENGIPFNKDIFSLPNKKGFEVVTNFLFCKLNKVSNDEFKIIWPLLDKKMEQEFRKTCFTHLTKIAKESIDGVQFPRMYPTMLISPGGDRFYELYLAFSTYVMQKYISEDKMCQRLCFPVTKSNKLQSIKETSLKLSTTLSTHEFLNVVQTSLTHQQKLEEVAEDFLLYYRHTKERISELISQKQRDLDILHSQCSKMADKEQLNDIEKLKHAILKKDENLHKVLSLWTKIEKQLSGEVELWDIVRSELNSECDEKAILNGHRYVVSVPEHITTNYKEDLQERKVQCLVENGKLSIKNFLNLWAVTVKCYADLFEKGSLPNTEALAPDLKMNISNLENYLHKLRTLNEKLVEMICEVASHIEELEPITDTSENIDQPVEFPPFTPTLTFTPKSSSEQSTVLPENCLFLTPSTSRKCLSNRRESRLPSAISPLHFNVLNASTSPVENHGYLKPNSNMYSSKKSLGERLPMLDHIEEACDYELNGFSTGACLIDTSNSEIGSPRSEEKSQSHEMDRYQKQMNCSLLKILSPYADDQLELFEIESSQAQYGHQSSLCFGDLTIENQEQQQFRTPPPACHEFNMSSVEKLDKLSKHLHSKGDGDSPNEYHTFPHLSFTGEEMLDDITLPFIPNF